MKEWQQSIKNLQQHVGQLIKQKEQLEKDCNKKEEELVQLKAKLELKAKDSEVMEMQHAMLKSAQGMLADREKKDLEKQLQSFIDEIDLCIAMLSR
jgi:chromosome segregation ATPase